MSNSSEREKSPSITTPENTETTKPEAVLRTMRSANTGRNASLKQKLPTTSERFFMNVEGLFQLVSELVNSAYQSGYKIVSPYLVNFAGFVLFKLDKEFVLKTFIEKSYKHWEQIRVRDEDFFVTSAGNVFAGLPLDSVNAFKELFLLKTSTGERFVTEDDRDAMWDYFDSLVRISIHWLQENPDKNKWIMDMDETLKRWRK
jgi:hypothetical protein